MQFAGQRTTLELNPIGDPVNMLIKLTPDCLPSPEAVLLTGITPQQTVLEGVTENEFCEYFQKEVVRPGTIFTGFNSIRFDDEFMRFILYRNFFDAYEWQWKDDCSRWDILDMVRMTRALRPEGIEWPYASDGKPSNRLELLTALNKLDHDAAHDALSDVRATIEVARMIRSKQPDLFEYVLKHRTKKMVASVVESGAPFVYTSGHFSSSVQHTTAVALVAKKERKDEALVFDLRFDPQPFIDMDIDDLETIWRYNPDPEALRLPVKTIKYNRCPAIAPIGVINDNASLKRLQLDMGQIEQNLKSLRNRQAEFAIKLLAMVEKKDDERERQQQQLVETPETVDARLYEDFFDPADKQLMHRLHQTDPSEIGSLQDSFHDQRLHALLPLFKARNFPKKLTSDERIEWDRFIHHKLFEGNETSALANYFKSLEVLGQTRKSKRESYLLEELLLYGQSLVPLDAA